MTPVLFVVDVREHLAYTDVKTRANDCLLNDNTYVPSREFEYTIVQVHIMIIRIKLL